MNKIMFTGHRDSITDEIFLENIAALYDGFTWIHGGASGFDEQVEKFAKSHGIETEIHRPDYAKNAPKSAPIIRNVEMLAACRVVVACYDGRKTGGTFFVVSRAKKDGKNVIAVPAHRHKSI